MDLIQSVAFKRVQLILHCLKSVNTFANVAQNFILDEETRFTLYRVSCDDVTRTRYGLFE